MSRGIERERQVKKLLEEDGWVVLRAAGSKGGIDLVALGPEALHPMFGRLVDPAHLAVRDHVLGTYWRPLLIEVKSSSASRGPYADFPPADRAALSAAAEQAGAVALLAWWPPRGALSWIPSSDWPRAGMVIREDTVTLRVTVDPQVPTGLPAAPPAVIGTMPGGVPVDHRSGPSRGRRRG